MHNRSLLAPRPVRLLLRDASILISIGLLWPSTVPAVHAEIGPCRSDPVVTLSNGVTFDLSANINDSDTDVQQVSYTLHAPANTSVTSITGTDGALGLKETFTFFADTLPNTYGVGTQVTTGQIGVAVTAETVLVATMTTASGSLLETQSASIAGRDREDLSLSLVT